MTTSLTLRIFSLPGAGKTEKNGIAKLRENCETGFQESAYPAPENISKIKRFRESGGTGTRIFQDHLVMTASICLRVLKTATKQLIPKFIKLENCEKIARCPSRTVHYYSTETQVNQGFSGFSSDKLRSFSRPPRYDHFDTSP